MDDPIPTSINEIAQLRRRVDGLLQEVADANERHFDVAETVALLHRVGELLAELRRFEAAIDEEAPVERSGPYTA